MTVQHSFFQKNILASDAPGQIVSEWLKLIGILAGIAATPLLLSLPFIARRLPWLVHWFWVPGLVGGVLTILGSVFYTARLLRQIPKPPPPSPLWHGEDPPTRYALFMRQFAYHHEMGWYPRGLLPVLYLYWSRSTTPSKSSKTPPVQTSVTIAPGTPVYLPALLVAIGIFISLPALVSLLLLAFQIQNPGMAAIYFSAPVLLLWIASEVVAFTPFLQTDQRNWVWILALLRGICQILAALLIWTYLGFSLGSHPINLLLYTGAGLAFIGTILATVVALGSRQKAEQSAAESGTRIRPASDTAIPGTTHGSQVGAAEFQIFTGKDEQTYFRLVDGAGEIVLVSEGYTSLSGCQNGIRSVRANAPRTWLFRLNTSADERYYFNLTARNRQVIGVSRMYDSEKERAAGITLIQAIAPGAGLRDLTGETA